DEEVYKDGRYPGPTKDARVGADGIAYKNNIMTFAPIADFFFGDFITLADPEASLGEKALATTFILVKPVKAGELIYDLSKARKVKTGGKGIDNGYQYWNKTTQFKNVKVYQRDDIINPNMKDARGRTNLERMQKGLAPLGPDGKSINLHHMTQRNESAIAEVTQTFHKENSSIIHINPNTIPSGINRSEFNKWRTNYWKNRANDF
ncbi:HNH/ENDO VII family nuclease, partial [Shouchella clausii]